MLRIGIISSGKLWIRFKFVNNAIKTLCRQPIAVNEWDLSGFNEHGVGGLLPFFQLRNQQIDRSDFADCSASSL